MSKPTADFKLLSDPKFTDNYELVEPEPIGKGIYGTVYQCKRKNNENQVVAVKIVTSANDYEYQQISKEIENLKLCVNIPNIIEFINVEVSCKISSIFTKKILQINIEEFGIVM